MQLISNKQLSRHLPRGISILVRCAVLNFY